MAPEGLLYVIWVRGKKSNLYGQLQKKGSIKLFEHSYVTFLDTGS